MFESVKQGEGTNGTVYFTSLLLSAVVHSVIICLLLLVPLLCFNTLDTREVLTFLIGPPSPPAPPPPPSPPPVAASSGHRQGPIISKLDFAPIRIPEGVFPEPPQEAYTVDPNLISGISGIGSIPGAPEAGPGIAKVIKWAPVEVPPDPKPPKPHEIVRMAYLDPSKLIYQVKPEYPVLAIKTHVSGRVILEAVIDEEGNVTNLKILDGHPLLRNAAVEAVRQWKYSPTILNGEPVRVVATVTVIFNLK